MRLTAPYLAVGLISMALAHPVDKRANSLPPVDSTTDESVLQLALYLEHLELSLYSGGYENFTDAQYTAAGFPPGFRDNVGVIAQVYYPPPDFHLLVLTHMATARSNSRRHYQRHS